MTQVEVTWRLGNHDMANTIYLADVIAFQSTIYSNYFYSDLLVLRKSDLY